MMDQKKQSTTIDSGPPKQSFRIAGAGQRFRRTWRWLTEPAASIAQKERPQVRLLSNLFLLLIIFLVFLFPQLYFFDPTFQDPFKRILFGVITAVLCIAYGLSRTRYHNIAAGHLVFITAASIWAFTIVDRSDPAFVAIGPVFTVVSILLSSLLLSARVTTWLSLLHLAAISLMPIFFPSLHGQAPILLWETSLFFVFITSALTALGAILRQQDQDEIKRQSQALSRSEERLRLVSYATNDAVWDWDLLTDQIERIQGMQRVFGYSPDQVESNFEWWEARLHPEDRERAVNGIRAAIHDGHKLWSQEYRFRRADNSFADVFDRAYVIHDEHKKPARMLGAMMDITRLRKIEQELAAEHNLLRTLIDNMPDNIYAKDTRSRFILANPSVARVMGASQPDQLLGKTDFDFYPPELAAQYYADEQALFQTGQPLVDREEPNYHQSPDKMFWNLTTKIPLRDSQGKIVGLVGVGRDITDWKYNKEALQDANREQNLWIGELERRKHKSALLKEMTDQLQTCVAVEDACITVSNLASQLFPEESGALYILNSRQGRVESVDSWGAILPDSSSFDLTDCWALRRAQLHLVDKDTENSPDMLCPHIQPPGPASYLCIPLIAQGEAQGLLHIRRLSETEIHPSPEQSKRWFTEEKQELARAVARSLSLALMNLSIREALREESIRDALTGMFNRRYLEEFLEREVRRANRDQCSLGIIMLDIDHFKEFNDSFGHQAGDAVLCELGRFLQSYVRGQDIVCRYGGEEFVIIMPDVPIKVGLERAEKLREGVKNLRVRFKNLESETLTISLGIAILPDHGSTVQAILCAADGALYRAKQAGRDRVTIAE